MVDYHTPKLIKAFHELPADQQRVVLQLTVALSRIAWISKATVEANGIDRWTTTELAAELTRRKEEV